MSRVVTLTVGAEVFYDGDACEVVTLDGSGATLRNGRTGHFTMVGLARLAGTAQLTGSVEDAERASSVLALFGLTPAQRALLSDRAGHVREMLSGYRSGHPAVVAAGEPRPEFDPSLPLAPRYRAKAAELGVGVRTVRRWVASYQEAGEAGLVDTRVVRGRGSTVDKRWEEALRQVLAEGVAASTPTRGALLYRAARLLERTHGVGVVPVPSTATSYRRLAEMTKGTNAVAGSAKGRRSIANRPAGVFGRLRATRPGEYVVLDTQDLDVFAMEPVTCRWVGVQLTVAQDLFTRAILGLRVTPVSTKSIDVAGVLYQAMVPPVDAVPGGSSVTAEEPPVFPYHGVPSHLVFSEDEEAGAVVACPPETLVVDHGKVFLSAHVISVCAQLGISIQPAQPYKPTDKPTVERFFRSLREGLIQHLPAYKGPDVHSRGEGVEEGAFLYLHELEDVIREWVGVVYHRRKHRGLAVPEWPGLALSPVEMHGLGLARAGILRMPARPELVYEFLEVVPRTIQNYGVEVFGLKYNGAALDGRRNQVSPYGGAYGGGWPIRVNRDDVRAVFFQDPDDGGWHRLEWEHAAALGAAFSDESIRYARRLAARQDRWGDETAALTELLTRWDVGMVSNRRERRMAARLAAERAALPIPDDRSQVAALPTLVALAAGAASIGDTVGDAAPNVTSAEKVVALAAMSDDVVDDLDGLSSDEDFYADAFEVLE